QLHQRSHFLDRPCPVLTGEGKQRQHLDAFGRTDFNDCPDGVNAGLVPGHSRHQTLARPAVIAIHDDGNVTGYSSGFNFLLGHGLGACWGSGQHQIALRSASLVSSALSLSAMYSSVSFWISSAARRSSSSLISFSFCRSFN